jgi:hypothetical protein
MLTLLVALVFQSVAPPTVTANRTGPGLFIYHQVSVGCDFTEHRFGRNASWGRWTALTSAVTLDVGETDDGEGRLILRCRTGDDCIDTGPNRSDAFLSQHEIPFATPTLAQSYLDSVEELLVTCAPAGE